MRNPFKVVDGLSATRIRGYLRKWALWWCTTSEDWQYTDILLWFIASCWEINPAMVAAELILKHINLNSAVEPYYE